MANAKNLRRGNPETEFRGQRAVEAQKKATEARKKNIAMRKAMKEIMAMAPTEVLSDTQIDMLRMEGIDTHDRTLMEVSVASIALQAAHGNVAAVKVIMELLGEDNAAEQRKIERERLALEREKLAQGKNADSETDHVQIMISESGSIEVDNGESDGQCI